MNASASPHVFAWLRDLEDGQGVFAQALDWAACLGWPLRVVSAGMNRVPAQALAMAGGNGVSATGPATRDEAWLSRCEAACLRRNVAWEVATGDPAIGTLGSSDLHIIGAELGEAVRGDLLRRLVALEQAAIMLCPPNIPSTLRLLVAGHTWGAARDFLNGVIRIGRRLQAEIVVLTISSFDAEARLQEALAEEHLRGRGVPVIFDAVIGCDLLTAVSRVARWRRCSHVVVQRDKPSWWSRWRGETIERMASLAETVSLVALPTSWQVAMASNTREPVAVGVPAAGSASEQI